MSIDEVLLDVVCDEMPRNAKVDLLRTTDDVRIGVSWVLGDDADRPNKRSTTIIVIFPYEALSDYANLNNAQQDSGLAKLREQLRICLENFDPHHNNPAHEAPPLEEWNIGRILTAGI